MGIMKEVYTDAEEIMENIDNRLKDKSAAYGVILTGTLVKKLQQKQSEIPTKWLESVNGDQEEVKYV